MFAKSIYARSRDNIPRDIFLALTAISKENLYTRKKCNTHQTFSNVCFSGIAAAGNSMIEHDLSVYGICGGIALGMWSVYNGCNTHRDLSRELESIIYFEQCKKLEG